MAYRSGDNFTVLSVCTGNICRSPAVEHLFRAAFGRNSGVVFASAGTGALVGQAVHGPMADLLREVDVPAGGFAARRVTEQMLRDAGLVLPLTREHRSDVVELAPAVVRRTFTLREFARLASQVDRDELEEKAGGPNATPASRLDALVPLAAAHRSAVDPELDDVVDPYRRELPVYRQSFDQILPAVRTIAQIALRL
ncbi:low molecular weight phosphatase family protein [Georgenia sp. EYE_87]|uniref:arsenate reductase/protein-tyrosine-phosphatase family protein n=1 Tax=Georgenia sp. EYE_87 TaxID=2853448 RepID=UPI0020061A84|nr:low molecular weight phosphatase family protein [Georgenia sp. EYE_87]MCK6210821.1 low molecular weight phosphatase family protein [Georgenia sp. EYE_87]